ncbi:hypothetical protein Tco_0796014 [Tanacetum coccineum]
MLAFIHPLEIPQESESADLPVSGIWKRTGWFSVGTGSNNRKHQWAQKSGVVIGSGHYRRLDGCGYFVSQEGVHLVLCHLGYWASLLKKVDRIGGLDMHTASGSDTFKSSLKGISNCVITGVSMTLRVEAGIAVQTCQTYQSDLPLDCSICCFDLLCSDPGFGGWQEHGAEQKLGSSCLRVARTISFSSATSDETAWVEEVFVLTLATAA